MNKDLSIEKILSSKSSRHHYIPQFLIEGFTNSDGFLYVYDKQRDAIQKKPVSPKSIFFERNRNTVEILEGTSSSFLEEIYSNIDNRASKIIKYYQNEEILKIDFKTEETAYFLFFLITLFWRIPYTDFAAQDIWNRSEIISHIIDPKIIRKDQFHQKFQRSMLFKHTIDEMRKFGNRGNKSINIHKFSNDLFVISDNPILFERIPTKFREFNDLDFLVVINSKRIYSSTNNRLNNIDTYNAVYYNMLAIYQSHRYTACSDLMLLKESIKLFKETKNYPYSLLAATFFKNLTK